MVNCMLCSIYFQRKYNSVVFHQFWIDIHQFGVETFQKQENEADSKQIVQTLNFCDIWFKVDEQRFWTIQEELWENWRISSLI